MIISGRIRTEKGFQIVTARTGAMSPADVARVVDELRDYLGWIDLKYDLPTPKPKYIPLGKRAGRLPE